MKHKFRKKQIWDKYAYIVGGRIYKDQIDSLQSMYRLMNISGAIKAKLACGATVVLLGDEDEDGINTDREFDTDKHMPLKFLEAVRESMRYFTDLTRKFVIENGAVRTPEDEERLEVFLRDAPKIENGFTYDELIELSNR